VTAAYNRFMGISAPCLPTALLAGLAAAATARAPDNASWNKPVEPLRVIGPVHFVGTNELAAFLVTTPEGYVLIDGGLPASAPLIEQSIRKLGLDPRRIRVLLATQAHFDHVGSLAHFKRLSGGRVEVMDGDVSLVESGGRTDYLFGDAAGRADSSFRFEPVKVDRTLRDRDTVYPGIAADYAHAFEVLESLQPDVFLGGHTGFFDLEGKRARRGQGGPVNPFVDPEGFRAHVASRRRAFEEQLARERAEAGQGR